MFKNSISTAWREAKAIVLGLVGFSLLNLWLRKKWMSLISLGTLGGVCLFFRDPPRRPASTHSDFIIAPADGKVTDIDIVDEPYFFQGPARRISVFLSLFDMHVQRSPYEGKVRFLRYQFGKFAPAFLKDVQGNEANMIGLETPQGQMMVRQTAGILARRIVCWVEIGDEVELGQRLGLIKFGSRVDLFLPVEAKVVVSEGYKVYAGQTILARW